MPVGRHGPTSQVLEKTWLTENQVLPPSPHSGSLWNKKAPQGFPGGTVVKNPPANAGDTGSSPGPGRPHVPRSN